MIKVLAAFNRKPGWSVDEFLCHYKERHAPLVAGIAGFTRHCRQYAQNYPAFESPWTQLEPHLARDALSEMWFDSLEEMGATYEAPDYLDRARTDEHRFADFGSALVYVCEEHEISHPTEANERDKQWAHLPLVKLFVFYSAPTASNAAVWQTARIHVEPEKLQPANARLVRGHVFSRRVLVSAADLPAPSEDTTAGVDEFRFLSISDAVAFANYFLNNRQRHAQEAAVDISGIFLARTHLVFSNY
jgi:uncharacterized protein (TIGR02118 family)